MDAQRNSNTIRIAIIGGIVVAAILVLGTIWMGQSGKRDTQEAVHTVSLFYLDELAGRREQVVENNLQNRIRDMKTAIGLMTEDDLSSEENLQAYQGKIKKLYRLEKFAFVDTDGLIHTSLGIQDNIDIYDIDYENISGVEISVLDLDPKDKKVIIAQPVDLSLDGTKLCCCFIEIDMDEMLQGISIQSDKDDPTFCNLYTQDGEALTNTILGGLAIEDNLLEAMKNAKIEQGYSYERFLDEFQNGKAGAVTFEYNNILETLSYVPVEGTDWQLTYLIRESIITDQISAVSNGIVYRSLLQSLLTVIALLAGFIFFMKENRDNTRMLLERETAEAEAKARRDELEEKLVLQEQLVKKNQELGEALAAAEQANKAKTAFLSNMSHEIRTPMNAIIGLDSIALSDPDTPEQTRDYLMKIGSSAEHLLNLINDILDMSRIESGRMVLKEEEFSLSSLLESINTLISGQCHEKGLDYQCRIDGEIDSHYIGDEMKLRQVMINILGNAVKFTPVGGSVQLSVKRQKQMQGMTSLCFTASDTGVGMSEEFLPHIFDTFAQEDSSATNQYGSSGLGLAITKSIVEMMNGDIQVESVKGEGSTFRITVTLKDSERTDEDMTSVDIPPEEMSVLVIDDDPMACEHAKLVLSKAGIAAEIATSGSEAIEMVKLRHARREPYNLILVDWQMPEMDGVETTRQIRSIIGNASAIIILTAYRWDDVLEEALEAGVDSFVSKPLFTASLLEEFRSAMTRRQVMMNESAKNKDLTGRRVLLAEDMKINAEIIVMMLKMRGMETDLAENGRIAVETFAAQPAGYYDAILMDMRMPEMDGLEATRRIRKMDREDAKTIPIIALTANAFDEDVQNSLQAGLNAHLSKPVQPDTLCDTLASMID